MEIEQLVYETLLQASSQHPDMLKPAEQKLKEWEVEPGFYSVLFVRNDFSITNINLTLLYTLVITCHKHICRFSENIFKSIIGFKCPLDVNSMF